MSALHTQINAFFQKLKSMDINKIQSALQSLKEEREHIDEYLQNAAAKKQELDKEQNSTFGNYIFYRG
jgi:hypothetical protein